jgi:hypothetical protein
MLRRFFAWIFGARLSELEQEVASLRKELQEHEQAFLYMIKVEQQNNDLKVIFSNALIGLNDKIGQMATSTNERLVAIENKENISQEFN